MEGIDIPMYATKGSAGFDFKVNSFKKLYKGTKLIDLENNPEVLKDSIQNGYIQLRSFERLLVGTGIYMELQPGYELQIRNRSGNSLKKGLLVANSPGTIDSDYRGEIGIILINNTPFLNKVSIGDFVAQGVIAKYQKATFEVRTELESSLREEGGFGSTDKLDS